MLSTKINTGYSGSTPVSNFNVSGVNSQQQPIDFHGKDNEQFSKFIIKVESSLTRGTWNSEDFSHLDKFVMPDLVCMSNAKKTGLNLTYVDGAEELLTDNLVSESINKGCGVARFIVNVGRDGTHFAVLDCKLVKGNISAILFEPANLNNKMVAMLAIRLKIQLGKSPNTHFSIVAMDIQRSDYECGIFSLALAKKLYKEREKIALLHNLNINNQLSDSYANIAPLSDVDRLLPPSFFKHTQGEKRLCEYLTSNPCAKQAVINKKGQSLVARIKENFELVNGKMISKSAHSKRLSELKSLMDFKLNRACLEF